MILISIFISLACAQQVGSTADAMGGAGIAGAHPYESAILNPAAMVEFKSSFMGLQGMSSEVDPQLEQKQYSIFFTDAGDMTMFPGALMYRWRTNEILGQKVREQHIQLSGAAALTKKMSVGVSAYKIRTDLASGEDYNQYNADVGTYWLALEQLSVGAVFRGVLGSKNTVWAPSQVLPSAGIGAEYKLYEMFKFRYDINYVLEQNSNQRFRHQLGGEVRYDFLLVLRTGFNQDDRIGENRWTAGIGWDGPRLKLAYAFQKADRRNSGQTHSIDMWLDF
ncbi:hypothetical protein K2X05_06450 [bacterium]|nr:hypothetical protein [bacterium]